MHRSPTCDTPGTVHALLDADLEVVVVVSRSVKALPERYGTSGNKSDRSDAYVLADCCEPRATAAARPPTSSTSISSTAPHGLLGDEGDARGTVTLAYVTVIRALRAQIDELNTRLEELRGAHPDAAIFRSLPRCATIRAATLLAEIGDCRARFPDPDGLACLAGVAPSTQASGRHRAVTFRFSSDTKLRNAICDFAGDSWRGNAWAEHRYRELRAAGKSHPHAERILARSWTHIIWRSWQDRVAYDPTRHSAYQRLQQEAAWHRAIT